MITGRATEENGITTPVQYGLESSNKIFIRDNIKVVNFYVIQILFEVTSRWPSTETSREKFTGDMLRHLF